jgi:hypothetical protein
MMMITVGGIYMVDNQNNEEDMFTVDETPKAPAMPKPVRVVKEELPEDELMVLEENEEVDEDDDESYVPIVEPFTTTNGYVFSLTAVQDEDSEKFVAVQLDNCTIEFPLQDVIEMISGFSSAIPKLIAEASKKD